MADLTNSIIYDDKEDTSGMESVHNGAIASSSKGSEIDPEALSLVANIISGRENLVKFLSGLVESKRDIIHECGLPRSVDSDQYQDMYDTDSLAARVNELFADACWEQQPWIFEDADPNKKTPFEEDIVAVGKAIRGKSWYQDEQNNPLFSVFHEADVEQGIGRYAVIYIGLDDNMDPEKPANTNRKNKLTYVRVFPESSAKITKVDKNPASARHSQPTEYELTFSSPTENGANNLDKQKVHWTRIVHISERHIYHIPRMQQVFNNLYSNRKVTYGSAEMYWRGALPGWAFETDPALGGRVKIDEKKMKDNIEKWFLGLQRYLAINGLTVKSLAPQVVDPRPQVEVQYDAIATRMSIPIRILKGSERGNQASIQDDDNWNGRVNRRRINVCTNRIAIPVIDRLIMLQIVRPPKESYSIKWPDLESQTIDTKATVALKLTQALAAFLSSGGENAMTLQDFYINVFQWDEQLVQTIIDNVNKQLKEEEEDSRLLGGENDMEEEDSTEEGQEGGLKDATNSIL